ncbi:MAG: FHA domain-containing protein [Proteobacteria bacterium]|nr:FHA domain-containing protein [Pseudomonadota bacterium]
MSDSPMTCPSCGHDNPPGFRFCGNCGANVGGAPAQQEPAAGARTLYFGAMQQPNRAKLILIKGEGLDGVSYLLNADEHLTGRAEGEIRFPDDPFLSPCHASFFYRDGVLCVRDEGSVNGVFVRIHDAVPIEPGTRLLVGEQLIELGEISPNEGHAETDAAGTHLYTSPRRPGFFKLIQLLRGGAVGMVFRAPTQSVSLGREGNDINFPDDPFISGHHAAIAVDAEGYTLTDLRSKNGTFVRIDQPYQLTHGDYVFLGQQLLRVEIT